MKKLFLVLCTVLTLSTLLFAGCAEPEPEPVPTPKPAPAPSPAPEKATKLVFTNWMPGPELSQFSGTFETWARDFEEKTGGRYEVEIIHGGALASIFETYDAVESGLADIGHFIPSDSLRPFPMSEVLQLPFLQERGETATKALLNVRSKGYLDKEYANVKLLRINASASADDLLTVDPINTLADLKGMKIATGGGGKMDLLKELGAVPVFAPPPEQYAMLQKGIVGGIFNSGYGLYLDHTAEFLRYLINPIRMFRVIHAVAMNMDTYNKMPDDVKQILDTMDTDAKYSLMGAKILSDEYEATMEKFMSTVGTQIDLNEADVAVLEQACANVFNNWIAAMEADGWPAGEVVAEYYNSMKALGVETPALGYPPAE